MSAVSMRIDIDKLTEAGDRVSFQPDGHRRVAGMPTRYNRKTVTVITDDGWRWKRRARLLGRADEPQRSGNATTNVAPLRKT